MKRPFFLFISLCLCFSAIAAPTIKAVRNGNWANTSTWNLNRLPRTGDTVVIPRLYTVLINQNINHSQDDIFLQIEGGLMLQNGKLQLSNNSIVSVFDQQATVVPDRNNPSNKIWIGGVEKYTGHEGTIYGPAYLSGTVPAFTSGGSQSLPVKFVGFSIARSGMGALVQWSTSEEVNASHYEVERSADGINWNSIAQIKAVGNSSVVNTYQFQDATPVNRIAHYRIRQVDIDGRFTYTAVKTVAATQQAAGAQVSISSTATQHVLIQFAQEIKTSVQVQIISLSGQVIARQEYKRFGNQIVLQNTGAAKGAYIVSVSDGTALKVAKQVML